MTGTALALVVGLGGALWAGMNAVDVAQNAMNSVWDAPIRDKTNFVARRLRSLLMLVVVGGALFATAATSTVASAADSLRPAARAQRRSAAGRRRQHLPVPGRLSRPDAARSQLAVRASGAVVVGVAAAVFQLAGGFIMASGWKERSAPTAPSPS